MASYKIRFKKSVAKDLRKLPKADIVRILERIEMLANNPRGEGCSKLSGQDGYRVRVGLYRIIYEIHDAQLVITVIKVGHRSSVYQH
ncbi:MAG: type II toxin-antitoxin system RelE/ParE family toxin [Gammaproteobacteria bacterium]|nr:MAG: type II toxin-antitoxin system RelE/ParE family toxin [Gammaproteobacteria bacterium]